MLVNRPSNTPRKAIYLITVCALLSAMVLTGCGGGPGQVSGYGNVQHLLDQGIRPNEMGMVMIWEYHRIKENESAYTRSIKNFQNDLQTLYDKGYRLVRLEDFMNGNIDVPAGTTPVVFSFDDSTESQFRYIQEGDNLVIDPECALGMMKDFYNQHKDFGYTALFNYLPTLFDQEEYKEQKVDYLYENGFEFGDHTESHPSLGNLSDEEVQKEIALPLEDMREINPDVDVKVICLPHGSIPENEALMFDGSYDGIEYHLNWSLLVGSNPMYPNYHYKNPGRLLPRIQVMDYDPEDGSGAEGSEYWLNYFDRNPELRFISDGNSHTICAPAYMESRLLLDRLPEGVQFLGY